MQHTPVGLLDASGGGGRLAGCLGGQLLGGAPCRRVDLRAVCFVRAMVAEKSVEAGERAER